MMCFDCGGLFFRNDSFLTLFVFFTLRRSRQYLSPFRLRKLGLKTSSIKDLRLNGHLPEKLLTLTLSASPPQFFLLPPPMDFLQSLDPDFFIFYQPDCRGGVRGRTLLRISIKHTCKNESLILLFLSAFPFRGRHSESVTSI